MVLPHALPTKHEGRLPHSLGTSSPVHYEPPGRTHSNNPHVRKSMAAGEIQHIGWAYERPNGKGRGFGTTGGHYHKSWARDDWRTLILNAIAWTAGVEVPKEGVPSIPTLNIAFPK